MSIGVDLGKKEDAHPQLLLKGGILRGPRRPLCSKGKLEMQKMMGSVRRKGMINLLHKRYKRKKLTYVQI